MSDPSKRNFYLLQSTLKTIKNIANQKKIKRINKRSG